MPAAAPKNANGRPSGHPSLPARILPAEIAPAWLRPLAESGQFEVAVPLIAQDELIGLITLGPRWDEGIFDERDLENADLIGQQATLFLVAARSVNELRSVPGRMAEVQDRERQRLARELHDTVQQFLGRLPFYLSVSRDNIEPNPQESRELLDRTIADVEDMSTTVRQIRHNLAPSQLEHGLNAAVRGLGENFEKQTGIATTVEIGRDVDPCTTPERRHALFRVVQQALDNVELHAAATEVDIMLAVADGKIIFSVGDNGRGFTESERRDAQRRGRYGMESMRARMEANGGGLTIRSSTSHGTVVEGFLPAAPAPARARSLP